MLNAAGEEGVELVRNLAEAVFGSGMAPVDWEASFILNLCRGKCEALDRELKLTKQVMRLLESVLDSFIRQMVNIGKIEFAFWFL